MRGLILLLSTLAFLFVALPARAFTVPPLQGHVTDTAGKLSAADRQAINLRLEAIQKATGNHVIVFLTGSLEGATIEDATYQTFQAWKVGEPRLDNGVLLVIAPIERRVRIETGKGVGGELTDLQASEIIRTSIKPALAAERWRDAVLDGANAIGATLERRAVSPKRSAAKGMDTGVIVLIAVMISAVLGLIGLYVWFFVVAMPRARREADIANRAGGYYGGGASNDSYGSSTSYDSGSSSSSSSDSSSSSSSSSDSSSYGGYDGGGGSSGGGGASDSW